jgi:hypothetical protein
MFSRRCRRRSLLHDELYEVLKFFTVLELLRHASVSWFFFERFLKHRGRANIGGVVDDIIWCSEKKMRVYRDDGSIFHISNFIIPPEEITFINRIQLHFRIEQSFPLEVYFDII